MKKQLIMHPPYAWGETEHRGHSCAFACPLALGSLNRALGTFKGGEAGPGERVESVLERGGPSEDDVPGKITMIFFSYR